MDAQEKFDYWFDIEPEALNMLARTKEEFEWLLTLKL